jgi:hypothetical protein
MMIASLSPQGEGKSSSTCFVASLLAMTNYSLSSGGMDELVEYAPLRA